MPLDLFTPQVPIERQHDVFKMILQEQYEPERAVLNRWATNFEDRDGKFVQEFQMSFEPCLWELYLNATINELGMSVDMSVPSPDFVVSSPTPWILEAVVTQPAKGGKPAFGYTVDDIPESFGDFNRQATLRICNSFDSKVRRYRNHYVSLAHTVDKPFVIGIGAFDRPLAHFAASRPIFAAMYGLYHDEDATPAGAANITSYNVSAAAKSDTVDIPLGLFCDDRYAEVSAVIYSSLATWGKVRALADNPTALTAYTTFHPNPDSIRPLVRQAMKADYSEHLLDGTYVLHNPFARHPVPPGMLTHPRWAEVRLADDGELLIDAPADFLLVRSLNSLVLSR